MQFKNGVKICQCVCFRRWLITSPPVNPWEPQRNSGFVAGRTLYSFKGNLEDKVLVDTSNGPEFFDCIFPDPPVKLDDLFIDMLPALTAELGPGVLEAPVDEPAAALPGSTAVGLVPSGAPNAFENIALAHREIYALYEIAQSMGTSLGVSDTMALISSKLSKIVSWSGCALFLYQQDSDSLKCRFAAGVDAPKLLNATMKMGHGLSGWVAGNR